jgi:hypothetical protein
MDVLFSAVFVSVLYAGTVLYRRFVPERRQADHAGQAPRLGSMSQLRDTFGSRRP